ncbi:hypothetical protein, partial [Amycolatopsis sp.]|uniref:hypothetical protein n=1 Tax=Amycolatopsis sp. TaxID=37632 RepID=UPI002D7E7F19
LVEAGLVPFAQGFTRLSAWAVQAPIEKVPADRALIAATSALRVMKEPDVQGLIRIAKAGTGDTRELDALSLVLDQLAEQFPEAHDAVLDALAAAVDGDQDQGSAGAS